MHHTFELLVTWVAIVSTMIAFIFSLLTLGFRKHRWWENIALGVFAFGLQAAMLISANHLEKIH